jgi:hypothetical protein
MLFALPTSLTCLIVVLAVPTCGRPVSPAGVSDSYSSYARAPASLLYDLLDTKLGKTLSNYRTPSLAELQRMIKGASEPCLEQPHSLPGSPIETRSSKILDVEVPLSTASLMSLSPLDTSQISGHHGDPTSESNPATEELCANQEVIDDVQYISCLQEDEGISAADPGKVYWDQERSMNAIVVILVLFLVIVLLAETAETMRKMSVFYHSLSPFRSSFFDIADMLKGLVREGIIRGKSRLKAMRNNEGNNCSKGRLPCHG